MESTKINPFLKKKAERLTKIDLNNKDLITALQNLYVIIIF